MISDYDTAVRLVTSVILGGLIGYERQSRHKSAGLRTHILVCLGSCLVMILSIELYRSVQGLTNADPARLAAQVVSGIGFLGAGTIMKEGLTIKGLTTAASLWVVSGVGLAVGAAYFLSAILTTLLAFFTLTIMTRFEKACSRSKCVALSIHIVDRPGQIGRVGGFLGSLHINIRDIRIEEQDSHTIFLRVEATLPESLNTYEIVTGLANVDGVISTTIE